MNKFASIYRDHDYYTGYMLEKFLYFSGGCSKLLYLQKEVYNCYNDFFHNYEQHCFIIPHCFFKQKFVQMFEQCVTYIFFKDTLSNLF